jgi:hypothetical protein
VASALRGGGDVVNVVSVANCGCCDARGGGCLRARDGVQAPPPASYALGIKLPSSNFIETCFQADAESISIIIVVVVVVTSFSPLSATLSSSTLSKPDAIKS